MTVNKAAEIVVTGFPKCGTTALMGALERDSEIITLRSPSGNIEVSWPAIKEVRPTSHPEGILAHKFTAYVYNEEALRYHVEVNPDSILTLCVRDPVKSLISWHKMHQTIAHSGRYPEHFAYKEREFYADCSVTDYYKHFAERRLRYDLYFERMTAIVPVDRIFVVSQERMAKGIDQIASQLKALARGVVQPITDATDGSETHKGYADKARNTLSKPIQNDLKHVRDRLSASIIASGVHRCL